MRSACRLASRSDQRKCDMAPTCVLIRRPLAYQVIADKAYDADSLEELVLEQGGRAGHPAPQPSQLQHR